MSNKFDVELAGKLVITLALTHVQVTKLSDCRRLLRSKVFTIDAYFIKVFLE